MLKANTRFEYLLLFLIINDVLFGDLNFTPYLLILFFSILIYTLDIFSIKIKHTHFYNLYDYMVMIFLIVWLYGVVLGLVLNDLQGAVQNFAGMSLMVLYFLKKSYPMQSSENCVRTVINIGMYFLVIYFLVILTSPAKINLSILDQEGTSAFRLYWSSGLAILIALCILSFEIILNPQKYKKIYKFRSWSFLHSFRWMIFLVCLLMIFLSGSKGFYLAFLTLISIIILFKIFRSLINLRLNIKAVIIFGVTIIILGFIYYIFKQEIELIIITEFSELSHRSIQKNELLNDSTFFGKGLGAPVTNGYVRDELGYGFELSFHNIFHKFGIFSLPIFTLYCYIILIGLKGLLSRNTCKYIESIVVLCLISFLIPSYGNPIIFAPINILLTILSIKILGGFKNEAQL